MAREPAFRRRHGLRAAPRARMLGRMLACSALSITTYAGYVPTSSAAVSVMRPPREARSDEPLVVTIVYSGDAPTGSSFDVPRTLLITLTNGEQQPRAVQITREPGAPEHLKLAAGEMKAVSYSAPWPDWARGAVRVDVPGVDVSPSLVLLTRRANIAANNATSGAAAASATQTATAVSSTPGNTQTDDAMAGNEVMATQMPPSSVKPSNAVIPDLGTFLAGRFSFYEPTYFADGWSSDETSLAKFQISLKFRFVLPDDPRSRGFVDNLYFAYTQTSLWDIRKYSAPFRDTSYKPALFYYLADTGWKANWFSRMGIETGYEHESNGRDGPESRGIDILYVKPIWDFGDIHANHLTIAPKVYWYEHIAGENSDIADYRGYVDLLIKYGSPDGWQLATTLRKGTKSTYGSVNAEFTYPLAKLFGNAWGGYLWVGYFNGYGEDILDYNQHRWAARIGFSLSR